MDKIQKGYYGYQFVPEVLMERMVAMRSVMPKGSRLIDIGCNDGTISSVFIKSGYASSSLGIDFEDIRKDFPPSFQFIAADLREFDLETLPPVDIVLCLNVLHHLCLNGIDFARNFMRVLSTKAGTVICDMGSVTTHDTQSDWTTILRQTWSSDEAMWADLFQPFIWRRPLVTYPFQFGQRVLWKLVSVLEPTYMFEVISQEGDIRKLRRAGTEEIFWAQKKMVGPGQNLSRQLQEFLRNVPFDCVLPLVTDTEFGDIYAFDPEIESGTAFTFAEAQNQLPMAAYRQVLQFAGQTVPAFADQPLYLLCDFRIVLTSRGLTFFHFKPQEEAIARLNQ